MGRIRSLLFPVPTLLVVLAGTVTAGRAPDGSDPRTKSELGRLLFWDPILSGNRDIACATCHHPDFAYADGRDLSLGTGSHGLGPQRAAAEAGGMPVVPRNAPTVLNTVFNGLDDRRGRRGGDDFGVITGALERVDQARAPSLCMYGAVSTTLRSDGVRKRNRQW